MFKYSFHLEPGATAYSSILEPTANASRAVAAGSRFNTQISVAKTPIAVKRQNDSRI
jgi:hypothetical protein